MLSRLAPKTRRQRSRIRNRSSKQHRPHIARQLETLESRHLLALVVSNLPAEEIAADSATIGASIVEVDTNPVLSIFWGDEDGGTNAQAWDNEEVLGIQAPGEYKLPITGLTSNTDYFFRAFGFSFGFGGQVWATDTESFSTTSLPGAIASVSTSPLIGDASAVVNGEIDGRGTLQAAKLYYGSSDGGSDPDQWENSVDLPMEEGSFRAVIGNLFPATDYHVRVAATNAGGTTWSEPQELTTQGIEQAIRIGEVMPANASLLPTRIRLSAENRFEGPFNTHDWVEIQNTSRTPADVGGYYLSDDADQLTQWQLPAGTIIPAGGNLVVFASGKNISDPALDEQGILHTSFSLDRDGETVSLSGPDGTLLHQLDGELLAAETDVSIGYFGNEFGPQPTPSPGASNTALAPVISQVKHAPLQPTVSTPITVTAEVKKTAGDIQAVQLTYRAMFEEEQVVPMLDDGVGGDAEANDGIYTAIIPAGLVEPSEMLRYSVSVTDVHDTQAKQPPFLDDKRAPEYFGMLIEDPTISDEIPVLHRFIEEARRAESARGTRASIAYRGEFYDNVFIRIRGGTARSWPKKAYKIEFNDDYHFRFDDDLPRVDEFNLNTTYTDKSYLRAILSHELYRDTGGIAPITFAMRVQQNGDFWSLAHFVEQPDRDYLRHNGLSPDGALYKARADRLNGLVNRAAGFYKKKTRHAEDYSDLQGLIDGLALKDEALQNFLFDHVDLPAQINLMAVNVILQNLDATDKNYYIYRDTEGNGEWKMLPWDLDLVLGPNALNTDNFSTSEDRGPAHTSHPYMGTLAYPFHGRKNHLFDAVVNSPRTNEMFLRRLRTLMDDFLASNETPVEERYFEGRIDELVTVLEKTASLDRAKWGNNAHFPGRKYSIREAAERIKDEYLIPRREHLFETHSIAKLEGGEVQVLIPEFAEGIQYFVPTDNSLGTSWTGREAPANVEQWKTGTLGLGFENTPRDYQDLIRTRVKPAESCETCTSFFMRAPFALDAGNLPENLTLRVKYDDAFVAYINGVEVARKNTRNDVNGFDSRARGHSNREAVVYENISLSSKISQIDLGENNVLAIHVLNSSVNSSDMLMSLELVDGVVSDESAVGIPRKATTTPSLAFASYDQNPASGIQDQEFVELANNGNEAVDLSGWTVQGGISHQFRGGTVIPAGESLYLTPDALAFRQREEGPRGEMGLFVQDGYQGHLSNHTERIELVNPGGEIVATLDTANIASDVQRFLRVTELFYNPAGPEESTEFIELRNTSETQTLDLTGVRITDGPSTPFAFSESNVQTLLPQAHVLVVKDQNAFTTAYPNVPATSIAGEYQGSLNNNGETIKIEDARNSTVQEFSYEDGRGDDEGAWHTSTDGDGFSLVIRDATGPLDNWNQGQGWKPSQQLGGSPGASESIGNSDYDGDGDTDVDDLDLLSAGVRQGDLRFDLNLDGIIDDSDRNLMITGLLGLDIGDSNLDGQFNSADFVDLFTIGEYEDAIPNNSGWADGDWNGDGDFTSSDLVTAFQAGTYTAVAATVANPLIELTNPSWIDQKLKRTRDQLIDAIWQNEDEVLLEKSARAAKMLVEVDSSHTP